jgi:hypothetical protein
MKSHSHAPVVATEVVGESPELRDMSCGFWVGLHC